MMSFPSSPVLAALLSVAMATPLFAQGEERGAGEPGTREAAILQEELRVRAKQAAQGETDGARAERLRKGGEKSEKGEEVEVEENLTPEQRLARNITSGASAHCRFLATVKPAKLLPGQTGTLFVTAVLLGHAVLPDPAPFEIMSPAQQGSVAIGAVAAQPAEPGRIEKAYLGRPVHENYAIFELPVTMGADAPLGSKHAVNVEMKFDLYDGNSGTAISRFLDRVTAEIEVGRVLDPAIQGVARPAAAASERPVVIAGAGEAPAPTVAANVPAPLAGQAVVPAAAVPAAAGAPTSAEPAATLAPPTADDGGLPTGIAIGGGAVVLLLLVLLLRRR
jgi:hypothetical protein